MVMASLLVTAGTQPLSFLIPPPNHQLPLFSCGYLMGGVGICCVNTFLVKVETFPGGTPLTVYLSGKLPLAGRKPLSACVS